MKNAFQKIDIKDLVIVVGGSIDSSVGYGVGVNEIKNRREHEKCISKNRY